ncbi:hypothetical protein PDJAM_G00181290, partial [Pangasius djambal]|nr:hypothetical protein [Pangasius djambal]
PYYEVGNLRKPGANDLPHYVREDYTYFPDNSNMDRIIVSLNNNCIERVYVTEHRDRSNFNKHSTYRISKHLIRIIRGLTLEEFLLKTGYLKQQTNSFPTSPVELSNQQPPCPAPPTTSICSPAITSSTTQDIQKELESLSILIQNNTHGHQEASPTPSICSPAITSSTNQDICTDIESPPIFTNNNNPQMRTTIKESELQLNNFIPDNTMQSFRNFNLQTPSKDIQTTSTCTPTIASSRNQKTDIKSPVSKMSFFFWGVYFLFLFIFF